MGAQLLATAAGSQRASCSPPRSLPQLQAILTAHQLSPQRNADLLSAWLLHVLAFQQPRGHFRWLSWDLHTCELHMGDCPLVCIAWMSLFSPTLADETAAVVAELFAGDGAVTSKAARLFAELPIDQQVLLCTGALRFLLVTAPRVRNLHDAALSERAPQRASRSPGRSHWAPAVQAVVAHCTCCHVTLGPVLIEAPSGSLPVASPQPRSTSQWVPRLQGHSPCWRP